MSIETILLFVAAGVWGVFLSLAQLSTVELNHESKIIKTTARAMVLAWLFLVIAALVNLGLDAVSFAVGLR